MLNLDSDEHGRKLYWQPEKTGRLAACGCKSEGIWYLGMGLPDKLFILTISNISHRLSWDGKADIQDGHPTSRF